MAYTPFTWHDGPGGNTPIVASRLNAIEQGIADAHDVTDALASLVPSVAALLDGAIVDHNLDVSNPANGYYLRWESGLQLCFGRQDQAFLNNLTPSTRVIQGITIQRAYIDVPLPSTFSGLPVDARANIGAFESSEDYLDTAFSPYYDGWASTSGSARFIVNYLQPDTGPLYMINGFTYSAMGRWK